MFYVGNDVIVLTACSGLLSADSWVRVLMLYGCYDTCMDACKWRFGTLYGGRGKVLDV